MPRPATEKSSFAIVNDGTAVTFTCEGSVVGGMAEAASWLPSSRIAVLIAKLQNVHATVQAREAKRAEVTT